MTSYTLTINDQRFEVEVGAIQGDLAQVTVNRIDYEVKIESRSGIPQAVQVSAPAAAPVAAAPPISAHRNPSPAAGTGMIVAPIPGKILRVDVRVGEGVLTGQTVAVMEAMKMENNLLAPIDGTVKEIRAGAGADVGTGDVVMVIG